MDLELTGQEPSSDGGEMRGCNDKDKDKDVGSTGFKGRGAAYPAVESAVVEGEDRRRASTQRSKYVWGRCRSIGRSTG